MLDNWSIFSNLTRNLITLASGDSRHFLWQLNSKVTVQSLKKKAWHPVKGFSILTNPVDYLDPFSQMWPGMIKVLLNFVRFLDEKEMLGRSWPLLEAIGSGSIASLRISLHALKQTAAVGEYKIYCKWRVKVRRLSQAVKGLGKKLADSL